MRLDLTKLSSVLYKPDVDIWKVIEYYVDKHVASYKLPLLKRNGSLIHRLWNPNVTDALLQW